MRACARVALASIAVSASFSLSGCAAIEELKETFLRWVESEKLPSGRAVSADELPEATPVVPPKKTPEEPSNRHPQPKDAEAVLSRRRAAADVWRAEPLRQDAPSRRYGGPSPQLPALMRRADASAST
jgi:hypothetical protein